MTAFHSRSVLNEKYLKRIKNEFALERKIRALLNNICKSHLADNLPPGLPSAERRRLKNGDIELYKKELFLILKALGQTPQKNAQPLRPVSKEEKLLTRLDFDGILFHPRITQYSEAYLSQQIADYINPQLKSPKPRTKFKASMYDISSSPVWEGLFKQFPSFASCEGEIRHQMATLHLNPETIRNFNCYDFLDLMKLRRKSTRQQLFEPARSKLLKMFAHCYSKEFADIMNMRGFKKNYTASLLDKMRHGKCDDIISPHHNSNIHTCNYYDNPAALNAAPNIVFAFTDPIHRGFHNPVNFEIDRKIFFFGGYDPALQINHDPERERRYFEANRQAASINLNLKINGRDIRS